MRRALSLALVGFYLCCLSMAQAEENFPVFAGTWNVTSTLSDDFTCANAVPGDASAYVWIVSQAVDGRISIAVQGKTRFPRLAGEWDSEKSVLVVAGIGAGWLSKTMAWFKLSLNEKGELAGVRRFVSDSDGSNGSLCFADSQVLARKQ